MARAAAASLTSMPAMASCAASLSLRSPKPPGRRKTRCSAAILSMSEGSMPSRVNSRSSSLLRLAKPPGRLKMRASAAAAPSRMPICDSLVASSSDSSPPPAPRWKKRWVARTASGLVTSKPAARRHLTSSSDRSAPAPRLKKRSIEATACLGSPALDRSFLSSSPRSPNPLARLNWRASAAWTSPSCSASARAAATSSADGSTKPPARLKTRCRAAL
mmetsp:Transcript_15842/g.46845  ORF Transcript_15842/g.46845 Transcript_15842/m.46845 type:complete len:218 (+) Transcript_15842:952-1605(+)